MIIQDYKRLNTKNHIKAFTLVEIMVGILLTTIVLTAAFMIWSKVRLGISRSHTKQILQNELRNAANYIQNDFKSIKYAEPDSEDALKYTPKGTTGFTMNFKKFKENKDENSKILAQDSIESVNYSLNSNVLIRKCDNKNKILSSHCLEVNLDRSKESDTANFDDKYKEARNSKLDIEIVGKMIVPGTGEEMYHVEKTSVVMRNEYYTVINKNYKSNFDLQEMKKDDVVKGGSDQDIDLKALPLDALEGMLENQNEVISQCQKNLEDINKTIKGESPQDVPWWQKAWAWLGGSNMYGDFKKEQEALEKAKTISEVNAAVKDIETKVNDQEIDFLTKSYDGYSSLSDKEKKEVKKIYDMAVHDKNVVDAYNKLQDKNGQDEPITNKQQLEMRVQGKKIVVDKDGKRTEVEVDKNDKTDKEEAQRLLDIYDKIKLGWMEEDEYKSEIGIYQSRKNLLESANTKIELIKVSDEANKNKQEILDAIEEKKKTDYSGRNK